MPFQFKLLFQKGLFSRGRGLKLKVDTRHFPVDLKSLSKTVSHAVTVAVPADETTSLLLDTLQLMIFLSTFLSIYNTYRFRK